MRNPAAALFILFNCLCTFSTAQEKINILTGVPPHAWLAERIAGNKASSSSFANKGVDPHTFEPTRKQAAAIYNAHLIINSGMPFEQRLIEKLPRGKQKLVLNLAADHSHHHHDGRHCNIQHTWLSPAELINQTRLISKRLTELNPEAAEEFGRNADRLLEELKNTQTAVSNKLADISSRTVYIFHPALDAFALEFGLEQIAIEHEGKSPGARRLRRIIADAKKQNVKAIFVNPQFDKKSAEAVAAATGARLIEFDPLEPDAPANILRLAELIAEINK